MADYPFYDKQPGPERREKLNELYATWEAAMGNVVKGDKGWSPLIRAVADGGRVVLQLYDWTDGQGTKPTQTGYLGAAGYVSDISLAIDFRGPIGTQGNPGPANTLTIGTVSSGTNASATITGTAPSQVLSLVLPKGDTGDTGAAATISVGTVTTGGAGTSASVDNSGTSSAAILNFTIPRGDKGEQGIQGVQGLQGVAGDAATIAVGTVTTGAAGTQVQVVNVGSPSAAVFDFTIPKGQDGAGAGDMLKADYDSVGDGVVNAARAVPWSGITEKPVVIASGATQEDARQAIGAASTLELDNKAPLNNPTFTGTVSGVTKAMVGLSSVDNTSDLDKPISTATQAALTGKVDKVQGKGLSTEDFTTSEKTKLSGIATGATTNQTDAFLLNRSNHTGDQAISTITGLQAALDGKQPTLESGVNIRTINGSSILGSGDVSISGGSATIKELHFHTTNTTYTVSAGQEIVRFYIGGAGGNGGSAGVRSCSGGGGGGFAFGDLSVNVGDVVALEFASGVAIAKLNGVVMGTANAGGNGLSVNTNNLISGGAGGTASIHASVTNGGAHSGGEGGASQSSNNSYLARGGGGSCGSPLGTGFVGGGAMSTTTFSGGGGAGIGGSSGSANNITNGGGGAGEGGAPGYGGGSGPNGASRGVTNYFADPLLRHATGPRTVGSGVYGYAGSGGAAGGGGGDFGGGGASGSDGVPGGSGGLMGGGGGGVSGGNGGYGGGGGGGNPGGTGGAAFGFLYY